MRIAPFLAAAAAIALFGGCAKRDSAVLMEAEPEIDKDEIEEAEAMRGDYDRFLAGKLRIAGPHFTDPAVPSPSLLADHLILNSFSAPREEGALLPLRQLPDYWLGREPQPGTYGVGAECWSFEARDGRPAVLVERWAFSQRFDVASYTFGSAGRGPLRQPTMLYAQLAEADGELVVESYSLYQYPSAFGFSQSGPSPIGTPGFPDEEAGEAFATYWRACTGRGYEFAGWDAGMSRAEADFLAATLTSAKCAGEELAALRGQAASPGDWPWTSARAALLGHLLAVKAMPPGDADAREFASALAEGRRAVFADAGTPARRALRAWIEDTSAALAAGGAEPIAIPVVGRFAE
ncbi:MAG: hypothetical protein SF028_08685 [Candidatus Sumerlaeia bacterium]|nr:hypothetical protein [Candidatus Sumerlaeia bacterium]